MTIKTFSHREASPAGESAQGPAWRALYPFESHWLEVDGQRMHYIDEAPAPLSMPSVAETLLFVHGNPTWSFHWRRLISSFRDGRRCVAPDHLGCGLSDKPARTYRLADRIDHLVQLIDAMGLRRITLVAQDWGGAIGLGAMLERPALCERIVLFNTGAFPPWFIPWRIRLCRIPLLGRWAVEGANLFSRAALRMTLARGRLDRDVAAGYLAPYDRWAHRRAVYDFVQDIPGSSRHPTWSTLAHLEARLSSLADRPALLCWGLRDWCFRPECLEKFLEHWPNAEVARLADVGHWVVEDAPREVESLVAAFLKRSELQSASSTDNPAHDIVGTQT